MENKPYAKEPRNNNCYPNKCCQLVDQDFRKKLGKRNISFGVSMMEKD
jgi:hypothetical protein